MTDVVLETNRTKTDVALFYDETCERITIHTPREKFLACWQGGCDRCKAHTASCPCGNCERSRYDERQAGIVKLDGRKYRCSHQDCNAKWWENVVTDTSPESWNTALKAFKCLVPTPAQRERSMIDLEERERQHRLKKLDHDDERIDREKERWAAADRLRDAVETAESEGGLDAFTVSFDFEAQTDRLPAIMERSDDATVLYAGKLNSIHGIPASGKSWVAIIGILEAVLRGGNVILWDFEDSAATFKRRSLMMGFDPVTHAESFKYVSPAMANSPTAIEEAKKWLSEAVDPMYSLVVIDAAESAGCPSDGSDVQPWFKTHVDPWREVGAGVLLIDHVPKRAEDRPRGQIGSQRKLAAIDGAALAVSGVPWTKRTGGRIFLHNHKDRGGDIPAPVGKCVAVIVGTYHTEGGEQTFAYTIEPPEPVDDTADLNFTILAAIAEEGPDGVQGLKAMRGLVKAKGTTVDATVRELVTVGMLEKTRAGRSDKYTITEAGKALLSDNE